MQFTPLFENSIPTFLFYALCFFAFIQLLYVFLVYARLAFYREKQFPNNGREKSVSIIICCRNEEENLLKNLQDVVEQDYSNFEVILVNHLSSDDSIDVMRAFQKFYSNVRVINVQRSTHLKMGKKFPLSLGIKAAKNELILLTDADCKPTSKEWLKRMVAHYENDKTELVLGYGPMRKTKGFLNWFSRMETTYIAVNYFAYALAKVPYMSVGRNFSYKKAVFEKNKGFKKHYNVLSGDDDLFLQETATRKNVSIEINEKTWCYSDAKETWSDWLIQKKRHYSASPKYKVIKKLLLGIYSFSWLALLTLCVTLMFDIEYNGVALIVFGGVFLFKWTVFMLNFRRLKSLQMALIFPIWETVYMVVTPFIFANLKNTQRQQWR